MRLLRDTKAQEFLEYALLAGFLVVAAGALMPSIAEDVSSVLSKVNSSLSQTPMSNSR
jgi:Flp pilus assembly pilin Flp